MKKLLFFTFSIACISLHAMEEMRELRIKLSVTYQINIATDTIASLLPSKCNDPILHEKIILERNRLLNGIAEQVPYIFQENDFSHLLDLLKKSHNVVFQVNLSQEITEMHLCATKLLTTINAAIPSDDPSTIKKIYDHVLPFVLKGSSTLYANNVTEK